MRIRIGLLLLFVTALMGLFGCGSTGAGNAASASSTGSGSSGSSGSGGSGSGGSGSGGSGGPVISRVLTASVATQTATITWTTDVASTSQIDYGLTTSYGQSSPLNSTMVTSHSVALSGLTAATTYHYRVRSKNSSGVESVGTDVTFKTASATGDTTPPTVQITAPSAGASVTGNVNVTATASDNVGVVGVQFLLDGAPLGSEDTAAPYTATWNASTATNGAHTLNAVARDAAGNRTTSATVSVTVANAPDTTPPTVSITSPAPAATVSFGVTVRANATDNVAVAGVTFMVDGAAIGSEVTASPYVTTWNTLSIANGSHSLTAIARDGAGNKTTSSAVTVTVSNPSQTANTAADADYLARCSDPNVVRCASMDSALPANTGLPVNGTFPDVYVPINTATTALDPATKIGSLNGSTEMTQQASSFPAGGKVQLNATPDTSFQVYPGSPSGNEIYVQWRQRVDDNYMAYQEGQDESNKQYIFTFGDVYQNSSTWASTNSCATGELVQINTFLLGLPTLYYSCGDKDRSYQGLYPSRAGDYLYQNAAGCLRSNVIGSSVNIVSAVRSSGVVTVTTDAPLGVQVGDLVKINGDPVPDPTSNQNTYFTGVHTVSAVLDATHLQFQQAGADQTIKSGIIAKPDFSHCWRYKSNQWMTFQLHIKAGTSYKNDYNYHHDSTVELWAAHEGEPSQLISSLTDYDLMFWDVGDSIGNSRPIDANWFADQKLTPGYGRMDFMQYQSNRCNASMAISGVQRSANVSTITFNDVWSDGAGGSCVNTGNTIVITGTNGFDGTWVVTSGGNRIVTFAQTGPDVASTSVTATATMPRWVINCNGGPCSMTSWFTQLIYSRRRVADPADYTTTPVPDPPDNLVVSAVDPNTGAVTLQWRDNAANETGFKIEACSGNDVYTCQALQASGNPWAQVGTAPAVNGRYGTQSFTYTPASKTTLYSFRIKATNASGDSTWSNAVQNTPPAPSNVLALNNGPNQNTITWTRNAPGLETGFTVYRCTGTAESGNCVNSNVGNSSIWTQVCAVGQVASCIDSTVSPATTYVYLVKSFNNAGSTNAWGGDVGGGAGLGGNNAGAQITTTGGNSGPGPLAVGTTTLASGTVGIAYGATLQASGGTPPYAWSIANGSLPAGLALAGSGSISGTPTVVGSSNFTVQVQDSAGNIASQGLTLTIFQAGSGSGLPTGIGWHSLGTPNYSAGPYLDTALLTSPADGNGSLNQCPKNNFNGDPYHFADSCKNVISAQSSGIADTRRNIFYFWGGGHGDYYGNEVYAVDLNASPVTLRRVKDPTTPTTFADPNVFKSESACVDSLAEDTSTPAYIVQSLTRDATGKVTVRLTTGSVLVPLANGNFGKGWVQMSGFADPTLNEGPVRITSVSTTSAPNDTFTYTSATAVATSLLNQGTATATWSSCMPDANGLGCSPNSVHSTGSLTFLQHPTDQTQDAFFKASGANACGAGDAARDTWTLPLDGGVKNSTAWVARHRLSSFSAPNGSPGGINDITEFDTTTGLTYVMSHEDNSLYAYDAWGTKGAANKWYMIAPFGSSDNLSGVLWHSSGDAQRLFFAVGGCTSMPITTIARAGGITTVNLSYIFSLLSVGSRVVVYGVADNSFNGGDGQNPYATVNSVSGLSISFPTLNGSTAASTGGRITWCDGMTGPRPSGVMLADVSNGTASTTQQDWTWGTLDVNNTDTANPALGNTCAEFLSGGQNPLNGVFNGAPNANGGASPGLTIDTVTNKIVGWPNEGTSIYQITPDPVNKRWTCSRQTYTANDAAAAPVDTSNNGAPHSTWGTWHRFSYFPQADVFFLINAPDQPARILRIR